MIIIVTDEAEPNFSCGRNTMAGWDSEYANRKR